jgi:thiol-disulfide isomerase/thioredoxin
MKKRYLPGMWSIFIGGAAWGLALPAVGAKPSLPSPAAALQLAPIQQEVDFARPTAEETEKCKVEVETADGAKSYVVIGPGGEMLRRFVDSNADNKVDLWCYFRDGVEVYRDIDSDGNGKADQYRWLGVAGIRWGIDENEDTKIDSWKQISAEEVTEEVVASLRTGDLERFKRVLLTSEELTSLGLSSDRTADLTRTLLDAAGDFTDVAKRQKVVGPKSKWLSFGGGKPGVFPVSSTASKQDIVVYDNVAAVVENDGKHAQVAVGTLVRVGDGWRVIDIPRNLLDDANATPVIGRFFQAPLARSDEGAVPMESGVSPELQELVTQLEKIDKDLAGATSKDKLQQLNAARADVIEEIIELAQGEDRETWLRQYAETVTAAVQSGGFPSGVERLKRLTSQLAKEQGQEHLVVFVGYRALQTDYNQSLQEAKEAQIPKIHTAWVEGLEKLVAEFDGKPEAAEPMLALAQEYEISGKEKEATVAYGRIAEKFPESEFAQKASGAKRRLELIGNRWMISGSTIDGKTISPSALANKVVVVQYWATWCDQCKQDFATLKALQAKYGKQGVQVVGVNLDSNRDDALKVLKSSSLPWPTFYEAGGFDSRYANEMGIFTLPLTILIDKQGKVVSRNIMAEELDAEVRKLLK